MSAEQTIELNGKTYPMLADGQYDCIILGTGLKECMLAGLLSKKGMKVNVKCFHYPVGDGFRSKGYYGGDCASLNLEVGLCAVILDP